MKISELIHELEQIQREHGDIPVWTEEAYESGPVESPMVITNSGDPRRPTPYVSL